MKDCTYDKEILNELSTKTIYKKIGEVPLHKLYHHNSELNKKNCYVFLDNLNKVKKDKQFLEVEERYKKFYRDRPYVELPQPINLKSKESVFDTILRRRSIRNFSNETLSINDFSTILYYSSGMTGEYEGSSEKARRLLYAYPSAGGLMPLDLYIFVNNVEGVKRGIYYYDPFNHLLRSIRSYTHDAEYKDFTMVVDLCENASFIVYITGSMSLTGHKYLDRGYRFMLLEAGHLAQNLYLTATAQELGAVASGGFFDCELKETLNIEDEYVLYEIIIGKPNTDAVDCRFTG